MKVSVRILVENTTMKAALRAEYGFSALVEVDGRKFLYDTGSRDALLYNAEALRMPVEECEGVIISHGHFDHTGALMAAVQKWKLKKLYAHSNLFAERYSVDAPDKLREISCVFTEQELQAAGVDWIKTDTFTEIADNVYVTGQIPRVYPYENTGGNFVVRCGGALEKDKLPDDMGMVIRHPDGLILISGCAHAGLLNMMRYAMEQTGETRILAFIGGTHLMTASKERLEKTVEEIKRMGVQHLHPAHCTGFAASAYLLQNLGAETVKKAETGDIFIF